MGQRYWASELYAVRTAARTFRVIQGEPDETTTPADSEKAAAPSYNFTEEVGWEKVAVSRCSVSEQRQGRVTEDEN
jgi:hypothetical protein